MRHHADDADEDEGERRVVEPRGRDPHAQRDRPDDVERPEDGGGNPAERHEVHDRQHPRVVEEAGHAARIERHRQARQRKRDVRDPEVEDRQQARRQLAAGRWRGGHVSADASLSAQSG